MYLNECLIRAAVVLKVTKNVDEIDLNTTISISALKLLQVIPFISCKDKRMNSDDPKNEHLTIQTFEYWKF